LACLPVLAGHLAHLGAGDGLELGDLVAQPVDLGAEHPQQPHAVPVLVLVGVVEVEAVLVPVGGVRGQDADVPEHPLVEAEAVVVDGAGGVVQLVQGLPAQLRDVVAAEPVEDGRLGERLLAGQALVGVGGAGHGTSCEVRWAARRRPGCGRRSASHGGAQSPGT
jgi:hypothetical protein